MVFVYRDSVDEVELVGKVELVGVEGVWGAQVGQVWRRGWVR